MDEYQILTDPIECPECGVVEVLELQPDPCYPCAMVWVSVQFDKTDERRSAALEKYRKNHAVYERVCLFCEAEAAESDGGEAGECVAHTKTQKHNKTLNNKKVASSDQSKTSVCDCGSKCRCYDALNRVRGQ